MKTAIAGWVTVAVVIGVFISRHGTHWEWGRLGMPEPILDANGRYQDGTPDPLNHLLIRTGYYQEAMWGLVLLVAGIFAWMVRAMLQYRRELREYIEVLKKLCEMEARRP